ALLARVAEVPYVLAALAAGSAVVALGLCLVRPLLSVPPLKEYELLAEERFPEGRSLFVNALELVPQTAGGARGSSDLVFALAHEANRRAGGLDLAALAPRALPRPTALLLAGAALAWAGGFGLFPGPLSASLARIMNPRAAAATLIHLTVEPGDVTI